MNVIYNVVFHPQAELRKLKTFIGIEQNEALYGYIKRQTYLNINKCHKLLNCVPSNMMHLFSHVKILFVQECECLVEIFESNDSIVKHIPKIHGLQYLNVINISQCDELKYVFSDVTMATSLPNLSFLDVSECKKMVEIIRNPISLQEEQHKAKIIFPRLFSVSLRKLSNLKCFYRSSFPSCVELPELVYVRIKDCPEMNTFWYNGTLYTPRLPRFDVEKSGIDVTKWKMNLPYNE